MVPARPLSANRPDGWSTPRRLSRYFSGVSLATKNRVSRLTMMPPARERDSTIPPVPSNSRLQRRAAEQHLTLDLEKGLRPHGQAAFVTAPLPMSSISKGPAVQAGMNQSSAEIHKSLQRATQVQALEMPYDPDSIVSPPAPVQHSRRPSRSANVTRAASSSRTRARSEHRPMPSPSVKRKRRNLSGQSFLDEASQEQLRTFLDSPSGSPPQKDSPPHQNLSQRRSPPQDHPISPRMTSPLIALSPSPARSPPTPAYQSPLQSRFYVDPYADRSGLSKHPSRVPSRLPSVSNHYRSISSVSAAAPPPVPRRPSQPSRLNSVSSVDSNNHSVGLGISAAASPISPLTMLSHTSSSNRH